MSAETLQQSQRTPRRHSIRTNLERLHAAQKPGVGVPAYTRFVNRRLARGVAATAASAGLGANGVTALSALLSAAGLALLLAAGPHWWSAIACGILLATGYVFDSADGQVARLTGTGSPAGEWLDHVVDAARTPAIHLTVALVVVIHRPDLWWVGIVAGAFAVLSTAQFMSQILAEQLAGRDRPAPGGGDQMRKSLVLLPTDSGVLCWSFAFWMVPALFAVGYCLLFMLNTVHTIASMHRKYRKLTAL